MGRSGASKTAGARAPTTSPAASRIRQRVLIDITRWRSYDSFWAARSATSPDSRIAMLRPGSGHAHAGPSTGRDRVVAAGSPAMTVERGIEFCNTTRGSSWRRRGVKPERQGQRRRRRGAPAVREFAIEARSAGDQPDRGGRSEWPDIGRLRRRGEGTSSSSTRRARGVRARSGSRSGIPRIDQACVRFHSGGGLGLGLGGSKRLVQDFHLRSEAGKGTTIAITRWK